MKYLLLAVCVSGMACGAIQMHLDHSEALAQAQLAQQWRDYNASVLPSRPGQDSDKISLVADFYGQSPKLLKAIRFQEAGRQYREMGFNGKHQCVAQTFTPPLANYAEAARRIAQINAGFPLQDQQPNYWLYLAQSYHHGTKLENKDWARNVRKIYKQLLEKKP